MSRPMGRGGIEPPASRTSSERSPAELTAPYSVLVLGIDRTMAADEAGMNFEANVVCNSGARIRT